MNDASTYATPDAYPATSAPIPPIVWVIYLAIAVLLIVSIWKIFTKAKQPGWAAIVPVYNTYIMLKMIGRPGWWILLMLVPLVNIVVLILVYMEFAKAFGRSALFGIVGLLLFPYVGFPILAFGKSQYVGTNGAGPGNTPLSGATPVTPATTVNPVAPAATTPQTATPATPPSESTPPPTTPPTTPPSV